MRQRDLLKTAQDESNLDDMEDWEYLLHHMHLDTEEETDEVHHCPLLDHLGNKYAIEHVTDVDGLVRHCIVGVMDGQEVLWSDKEAEDAGYEIPCAHRQLEV